MAQKGHLGLYTATFSSPWNSWLTMAILCTTLTPWSHQRKLWTHYHNPWFTNYLHRHFIYLTLGSLRPPWRWSWPPRTYHSLCRLSKTTLESGLTTQPLLVQRGHLGLSRTILSSSSWSSVLTMGILCAPRHTFAHHGCPGWTNATLDSTIIILGIPQAVLSSPWLLWSILGCWWPF